MHTVHQTATCDVEQALMIVLYNGYPNGERRKNKAVPGPFGTRVNVKRLATRCESSSLPIDGHVHSESGPELMNAV